MRRNGGDRGRLAEMALRALRGVQDRLVRRQRRQARGAPGVAALEGDAGGHAGPGAHVQEARGGLLADLAHAGARRRGLPGPVPRRHLARPGPRRADGLRRCLCQR